MGLIDWLIVIIPTVLIVGVGIYSRRYIKGVADFLSAGRVAGRYVISIGDVANALSIDRKSTRLNSSHIGRSRMPSSA